jgi:hypothetical protein
MQRKIIIALIVIGVLMLGMVTMALLRSDCEQRGGTFEYTTTYKTYICTGAKR